MTFPALRRFAPVLVLAGLGFGLAACSDQKQQGGGAPQAAPVTVAKPQVKQITDYDEYVGRFTAIDLVQVTARVSGYLDKINFTDGQLVKKGDQLFGIDPRPYQVALDQAKANLARSQADLDFAISDLQRAQTLIEDRVSTAISKQTFDQRQQTERSARAQVAANQAAVHAAELDLEFTTLTSPVNGRMGDRRVSIGNLVTGGQGGSTNTLLATIVSTDPIYFEFTFDEASYIRYQQLEKISRTSGSIASIPVSLGLISETGFPHKGEMNFVDNVISENTGTIRGRAVFANPDGSFTPGMFGRIRVPASLPHDALLVPDVAIGTEQTRKFVYVMASGSEPQVPKIKYVTLGRQEDGLRVITSGLEKDDLVVVNGLVRIRPGAKVVGQPEPAKPAAAPAAAAPAGEGTTAKPAN
ncbi:efflux RND transporter periplasmic adaptor subunit [Ancylobacter defluvii]|uniref:MexE family multidrug efflux RND transporter periplasmic adaptor subunit n=1 Tax=Ancylobacter defluvii TaxID=1282440 RepID=A0A9W6JSQ1_9HYPH|nr:efflux RND transporter periplasmic adaptor subunit [Ancylobacter defluvii]MBS7587757.1 efflux RND transporter periplasmic adaptor subunit [Ancylobacter defluvii]GLK82567.1 MexE family multidrug efflux RND transporter periplasmic adaptor subunit [Ancylobacter defluvii]